MMHNDTGSSLVEVLVAIVILALAGTALISGTYLSNVVAGKAASKSNTMSMLDDIAQQLTALPYNDCLQGTPYPTPTPREVSSDLDPQSLKVDVKVFNPAAVTDPNAEVWLSCPDAAQVNPPTYLSSGVQRVVLTASPVGPSPQPVITKVLVKVRG